MGSGERKVPGPRQPEQPSSWTETAAMLQSSAAPVRASASVRKSLEGRTTAKQNLGDAVWNEQGSSWQLNL